MIRPVGRTAFRSGKVSAFLGVLLALFAQGGWSVAALSSALAAQGTSSLSGVVTDETGAVIAAARITVLNSDTGFQRWTTTGTDGYFVIPLLPPGTYAVTAEMIGFAPVTVADISLVTSVNTRVEIALLPKPLSETLDVKAGGGVVPVGGRIDISTAVIKHTVTNEQVISLPVFTTTLGRNTLGTLPFLLPGVSPASAVGTLNGDANRRGNQMSINGARTSSVNFNFEGGDNNDQEYNRAAAPFPNPDALQEFTVMTNSYEADFGRSLGGVVNAVVKSGTTQYRGNLRYFLINDALNARGFFDPRTPRDRVNTFGGQAAGPVKLPKFGGAFFFLDYEGARASRESLATLTVLSPSERQGDYSARPVSEHPFDPATGQPFPSGRIPASRIDPISREYLQRYIPLPNADGNRFVQLLPNKFRNDQLTARLDFKLGECDSLILTYFWNNSKVESWAATLPVGSKTETDAVNQNLVLRETHTLSARTVNQLTVTATRFLDQSEIVAPGATGVSPAALGFTGVRPQSSRSLGVPAISIQDTSVRIVTGGGTDSAKTVWQIKDDLAHIRGAQELTLGGEARRFLQKTVVGSNNGSFSFSPNFFTSPRDAVANFLLGIPVFYFQTTGGTRYPNQTAYALYAMDRWRLRPNLTVTAGLRYELAPPFQDKLDQVSVFRPGYRSERFPQAPEGILFVGDPDPVLGRVPRGGYRTDKNDFAPRLGVAWSPKSGRLLSLLGQGATAVRAGFGVITDQTFGYILSQAALSQPFSISEQLNGNQLRSISGSFANPYGLSENPWPLDLSQAHFTTSPELQPFDPAFRTAYTYQYNLTVQRELGWAMLMEIAYVGSNSFKLNRERELNLARDTGGGSQTARIYPAIGRILSQESTGRARYDSLQTKLVRRADRGVGFAASYVFGKSLDDSSEGISSVGTDAFRWGRSAFDRRHNFVLSFVYTLPRPKLGGIADAALGGWRVSGITEWRSGQPIDISQGTLPTLVAGALSFWGNPDVAGAFRRLDPRRFQTVEVNGVARSGNFLFDPNAFRTVTERTATGARAGTLGRNVFDGPGVYLTALSFIKQFRVSDTQRLDVRGDVRNLFNRPHFLLDSLSLRADNAQFGQVVSAAPGRIVQLSLRYSF